MPISSAVYGLAHIGHLSGAAVAFLVHHFMTPATIKVSHMLII